MMTSEREWAQTGFFIIPKRKKLSMPHHGIFPEPLLWCPMLLRLRGRIRGRVFDSADVDQLVVATFLEVVRVFPLDQRRHRTCMYLRQMTQRRVLQVL